MQVRRSSGGNIANKERRTLTPLCISSVVQRWRNWHAADRSNAARTCGGGEDAVNEAGGPVRLKCCEMGIKIHPFGLPLLLVDVRNPHQWRTPCP